MKILNLLSLLTIFLLPACTDQEIGSSKDVNPDAVFTKYNISYEEGSDVVECRAQFRFGGEKGTTLVLSNPSKITFDGTELKVDSSKSQGAYYAVRQPFSSFAKEHTWAFTGVNNKIYRNAFVFTPFSLATPIPATISKGDLKLQFNGVKAGSLVHVSISDTSSRDDIDTAYTVNNNKLTVAAADMKRLKNGPVVIEIYQDISTPLKEATPEGGKLNISYALKRKEVMLNGSAKL